MSFRKSHTEKNEIIVKTTQTSQSTIQYTTQRSVSLVSNRDAASKTSHRGSSVSLRPHRWPSLPNSNLPRISTDAVPLSSVNLNYQSPSLSPKITSSSAYQYSPITTSERAAPKERERRLVVKKGTKFHDGPENVIPTYSTHSTNRGEVLIINNIMFPDKEYRRGAEVDDKKLNDVFSQMGFKVKLERDLKLGKMVEKVRSFSKKASLSKCDIAIVIVMSHGTANKSLGGTEVFGLDDKGILIDELIQFFNEKECKAMKDKPKIFIFQCCRGDNEHFVESDSQRASPNVTPVTDALVAYSSLPGFVSHRDPQRGTWYISTLCEVFSEHAHDKHVEDLLKIVNTNLGKLDPKIRQTAHYENRGFKRCYLHPM